MNKHTTLPNLMQKLVSDEEIQLIAEAVGYRDSCSFAVFSLGSFLSIGNPGWPLLCLSMPKFMEGVCIILDNQHSCKNV
ncbi:hypothetical protein B9L21_16060 [Geobacillus uzenensis]|uniref:Uncharacterized protein n=1 Tax=Geobacillus uzenensis TaxID=129339 RepID=A0ABX4DDB7_9BACL|nr:hypothetical protein [Geobacillus uzenensis]OXB85179.1 hypothetical protein B9L21_16060 [Geobacillus uzenensis]